MAIDDSKLYRVSEQPRVRTQRSELGPEVFLMEMSLQSLQSVPGSKLETGVLRLVFLEEELLSYVEELVSEVEKELGE